MAAEWLVDRFAGIELTDYHHAVHFMCISELDPPPGFEGSWTPVRIVDGEVPPLAHELLAEADAVVILSHPFEEEENQRLRKVIQMLDGLAQDVPPMIWLPHTCSPENRPEEWDLDIQTHSIVQEVLELGLDGIIIGEPAGFKLVLGIQARLSKSTALSRTLNEVVNERRLRHQQMEAIQESIHNLLWDYLRVRVAPAIPPMNYQLTGQITRLGDYTVGQQLGSGLYGRVLMLERTDGMPMRHEQVINVIDKDNIRELSDLKCMQRMIEIHQLLSSPKWAHPHVVRLYEVYHSQQSIILHMECGGSENLFRRLLHREKEGVMRFLSAKKVSMIISQAISVMAHLHLGPKVCHRDIKPENFIVSESEDRVSIKLAEFDLAVGCDGQKKFCMPCGTVPFVAPEVLLEKEYKGPQADIWSLGIVFLEILCCTRIVEQIADLQKEDCNPTSCGHRPNTSVGSKIRSRFEQRGSPGRVLKDHCKEELRQVSDAICPYLNGMLAVEVGTRSMADDILPAMTAMDSIF